MLRTAFPCPFSISMPAITVLTAFAIAVSTESVASPPSATFSAAVSYELSRAEPKELLSGDFNADGHIDFVITCVGGDNDSGKVNVLLGDGSGDYSNASAFFSGAHPWGAATEDFNRDGILDLAVTESGHDADAVHIFLGDGTGGFTPGAMLAAGSFPLAVATGDFNEDGLVDLAVANNVSYGFSIFRGYGDGTFSKAWHMSSTAGPSATDVAAADFDLDGHIDLALSHYSGVALFAGLGDGTFSAAGGAAASGLTEAVAVGDLNNDTYPDVVAAGIYSSLLSISLGNGAGGFSTFYSYAVGSFPRDVALGDVNLDGALDIVVPNESDNTLSVLLGLGDGQFSAAPLLSAGPQPGVSAVGDWNEDGYPDIAAPYRNYGDTAYVAVLSQTGDPLTDTDEPSVALISPANGDTVSGIVPLRADVFDQVGVVFVEFYDGATIVGSSARPYLVGWNTSTVADGIHELTAVAYDAAGNSKTSFAVEVYVDNHIPVITSHPPFEDAVVGVPYAYQVTATGIPAPAYSLIEGPAGLSIDAGTGLIAWIPGPADGGPHTVTVRAANSAGHYDQTFSINVVDTIPPSTPFGLHASATTATSITLMWGPSTDNVGVIGYHVYEYVRVNRFYAYWALRVDNLVNTTATIQGLASGSTHKYAVTAFDTSGNESYRSATLTARALDVTAVDVQLTSPVEGAVLRQTAAIAAAVSDPTVVSRVVFLDGGTLLDSDVSAPYTFNWDTLAAADGAHAIEARAYSLGNSLAGTSAASNVVVDNTRPSLAIIEPAKDATVAGTVTIRANASDAFGMVRVIFKVDGATVSKDKKPPYEALWDTATAANGLHTIKVIAIDRVGNRRTKTLRITVAN